MSFENFAPARQENLVSPEAFGNTISAASGELMHEEELAFHAKAAKHPALANMSMITKHAGDALLKLAAEKVETQPENISGAFSYYKNVFTILSKEAGIKIGDFVRSFRKGAVERIGQDNVITPAA